MFQWAVRLHIIGELAIYITNRLKEVLNLGISDKTKVKLFKLGMSVLLCLAVLFTVPQFIISLTPQMKEKERVLLYEYEQIKYPEGSVKKTLNISKGVTRRILRATHEYPLDTREVVAFHQKQFDELGWKLFYERDSNYFLYTKGEMDLYFEQVKDYKTKKENIWMIMIKYKDDNFK